MNNNREITTDQITLGHLFRNDNDGNPLRFNNRERRGNYRYRIPIHQRYPQWKNTKINKLINSVLSVYAIGGIIVSKHIEDNIEFFNIEDGQSRLSVLQRFYNDEITYNTEDNDGNTLIFKYSELDENEKEIFKSTIIPIQILINFSDDDLHEQFERLQDGEPLRDKDLYWNRSDTYFVQYALNLTRENFWINEYMGTTKPITDTHRDRLPDVCALISAFVKEEGKRHITSSFKTHFEILNKAPISEAVRNEIKHFLEYYSSIIRGIYNLPENEGSKMRPFYNVAKDLGMVLIEYLDNPNMRTTEQLNTFKNKWITIINYDMNNDDFMKGRKLLWTGLTSAERQNTHDASLRARVNRVNEYHNGSYNLP